jgi:hypothetical protein
MAREQKAAEMATKIEEQVFKCKMLQRDKELEQSGKNLNKLNKQYRAGKRRVNDFLISWADWSVYKSDQARAEITSEMVEDVMKGLFPWRPGGEAPSPASAAQGAVSPNGPPVAQRHFGKRYEMAKAQVDRTREEVEFLKIDMKRTIMYFGNIVGKIRARLAELKELWQQLDGEAVLETAPDGSTLLSLPEALATEHRDKVTLEAYYEVKAMVGGMMAILNHREQRYAALLIDAEEKLGHYVV